MSDRQPSLRLGGAPRAVRRGRSLAIALAATLLVLGASQLLARLAVEDDAAGALLGAGGAVHPWAWMLALGYVLARLAGAAMVCISFGLAASYAAHRLLARGS